jgi:predicted peptidase
MKPLWIPLAVGVLYMILPSSAPAADGPLPLEKRTYTDAGGQVLRYRLLKPEPYDPKKKYPLVLFLHGAGERGDDNNKQLVHGVAEFAKAENRQKYPCFLVAPQCPNEQLWSDSDWRNDAPTLPKEPTAAMRLTLELLEVLQKDFAIDADRLYVTGLSMGGFGTWDVILRHPKQFAAAVPICGGGDPSLATRIAKMPIWVFHGAKDRAVPVSASRKMVAALKKATGHPKYTEYPNVDHFSWVPAYRDPEMFRWLFGQKRKGEKEE